MSHHQELITGFLASSPYYPCALLVSPIVVRLEVATSSWPRVSVGLELSIALRDLPGAARAEAADAWARSAFQPSGKCPVVCTEIDLLFEPALNLDPLVLLRVFSRIVPLVVAWPGTYSDGVLAYAVPEHAHYRTWREPEVLVVTLE